MRIDSMNRRKFLAVGAGGAMAAVLAACGEDTPAGNSTGSGTGGSAASGEGTSGGGKEVVVQAYGGEYQGVFEKAIKEPYEKQTGNKITYVVGGSGAQNYAAIRAAGGTVDFDVSVVTSEESYQGSKEKVLAELTPDKIPNIKNVYPDVAKAVTSYGACHEIQQAVLVYDRDLEAPTSWADMWAAKNIDGTIVWNPTNVLGVFFLFITAKMEGGSETDLDPGWTKLAELADHAVATPTSSSEAVPYMEKQTATMFPYWDGRAAIYKESTNYDFLVPDEGTYALVNALVVPSGAPHQDAAFDFINYWLSTEVQARWAQAYNVGPGVSGTELPAGFAKAHITTPEQLAKASLPDHENLAKNRGAWLQHWQQIFGR